MNCQTPCKRITTVLCFLLLFGVIYDGKSQVADKGLSTYLKATNFSDTTKQSAFGTKTDQPFALEGSIYYLSKRIRRLPDFSKLTPVGSIYTTKLNIPKTKFRNGFPGVTDRFEWFAIDYKGSFYINEKGNYSFKLTSDDGSKLYINDKLVINNDGLHAVQTRFAKVELDKGMHKIEVQYFQGPREDIALSLLISNEGAKFREFNTLELFPGEVEIKENEIRINLTSEILFDFNKSELADDSKEILREIKESFFDKVQSSLIVIEGHTDNVGTKAYNKELAGRRAREVKKFFMAIGMDSLKLRTIAYGEEKPKFENNNNINRSKNRRVEIVIKY